MLKIRNGLFETNSSSASSFSHTDTAWIPGYVDFTLKVKCDTEPNTEELFNMFINWLNIKYSKGGTKIVKFKLDDSNSNNFLSYLITVSARFKLKLTIYIKKYYKNECPSSYWVNSFCTYISEDIDRITESFNKYLNKNYNGNIKVIELLKNSSQFDDEDIDNYLEYNNNDRYYEETSQWY